MATKDFQIIPESTNDYGDVLHPETNAGNIIDTATKVIMTKTERDKLAGIQAGAQVNPSIATTSANGLMSKEDKIKINSVVAGASVKSVSGKTGDVTLVKADVGLSNVDNAKQMPIAGGTFTGVAVAQNNTSYTTKQIRNITLSIADPSGGSNGDIWIKYEA